MNLFYHYNWYTAKIENNCNLPYLRSTKRQTKAIKMKNFLFVLLSLSLLFSCNQTTKSKASKADTIVETILDYPDHLESIFDAHGGIETWNTLKGLYFEIEKPVINDRYDVALSSRKSLIRYEHHELGFDGENVWLKQLDTVSYTSNPKFLYNLMFYFYAMPFVLGDDGINYEDSNPLHFEGKEYPGIKISYDVGVGTSSDDEYIIYYNSETYRMEWLAYTVTFFSKEKSKEYHFIKYGDWETIEDLTLPKTLTWYNYEDAQPTTKRSDLHFLNVKLSTEAPSDELFKIIDSTTIIK